MQIVYDGKLAHWCSEQTPVDYISHNAFHPDQKQKMCTSRYGCLSSYSRNMNVLLTAVATLLLCWSVCLIKIKNEYIYMRTQFKILDQFSAHWLALMCECQYLYDCYFTKRNLMKRLHSSRCSRSVCTRALYILRCVNRSHITQHLSKCK